MEQSRIDEFADVTRDHQWIHVDVERVETESPYGATITQGFLTLSLIPGLSMDNYRVENARMGINYGLNPVGFASLPHRRYRAQRGALPRRWMCSVTVEAKGANKDLTKAVRVLGDCARPVVLRVKCHSSLQCLGP